MNGNLIITIGRQSGSGGKVIGQWNVRTQKDRLHIQIKLWEHISAAEYNKAEQLADEYAAFRQAKLVDLRID